MDAREAALDLLAVPAELDPGVWMRRIPGALGLVTGIPFPTLNAVIVHGEDVDRHELQNLFDDLPHRGLPHSLQAVPQCVPIAARLADGAGFVEGPQVPLMTLGQPPAVLAVDGLRIRRLDASRLEDRTAVAAAGFEVDPAGISKATQLLAGMSGYQVYLGEVDGAAVTTAVGILRGGAVGIFDVATPPPFRGHGYGAAITAHVVRAGFAQGATWSWLQSSAEGLGVYQRLGFATVEQWSLWVAP